MSPEVQECGVNLTEHSKNETTTDVGYEFSTRTTSAYWRSKYMYGLEHCITGKTIKGRERGRNGYKWQMASMFITEEQGGKIRFLFIIKGHVGRHNY